MATLAPLQCEQARVTLACGRCGAVWLPVQAVQFSLVPQRYKVVYLCVAAFIWSILLSLIDGSVHAWAARHQQQRLASAASAASALMLMHHPEEVDGAERRPAPALAM